MSNRLELQVPGGLQGVVAQRLAPSRWSLLDHPACQIDRGWLPVSALHVPAAPPLAPQLHGWGCFETNCTDCRQRAACLDKTLSTTEVRHSPLPAGPLLPLRSPQGGASRSRCCS